MTQHSSALEFLRAKRDSTTDPSLRNELDTTIALLESTLQQDYTDTAYPASGARNHQTDVSDDSKIDVLVSGDVNGDVQTGGQRYQALTQLFFVAAGVAQPNDEQRGVLTSYLDSLAHRLDRLRLLGVAEWERKRGKAPTFTLSQVYVTLASTIWQKIAEAQSKDTLEQELKIRNSDMVLPQNLRRIVPVTTEPGPAGPAHIAAAHVQYCVERPLLLTEALSQRRRVVLLGGPGSGKSSFLHYLAIMLARSDDGVERNPSILPGWSGGLLLPLYASLSGFTSWIRKHNGEFDGDNLWNYIITSSETYGLEGLGTHIRRAFHTGKLLLLLDGLDEVPEPELRTHIVRAIAELSRQANSFVAVTCRVRAFTDDLAALLADWGDPIELAPFTPGQMQHFVRCWYTRSAEQGALEPSDALHRAEALIEQLRTLPALGDLGQIPLLLTVIIILHYYDGKLPEDRADLYEDIVQLLLTRWTQQRREVGARPNLLERLKADGSLGGLKDYHLRGVLEELAFGAHRSTQSMGQRGLLDRDMVRGALIKLFKDFDLPTGRVAEKTMEVLVYLEEESGLLQHEGDGYYGLPHLTYEEYMAGCYLAKRKGWPDFCSIAYTLWRSDPVKWREVILLALGRMVRGDDRDTVAAWLQFLIARFHGSRQRTDEEVTLATLLAAECLIDLGGKSALIGVTATALPDLWNDLAWALADTIESTIPSPASRVRTAMLLGQIGDLRPGVCELPPEMAMYDGGSFLIGWTKEEADCESRLQKDQNSAKELLDWLSDAINDCAVTVKTFEIARYPVTNAQYALFIAENGYDSNQPWWNEIKHAWLSGNDDFRWSKNLPEFWQDAKFGNEQPNYPVVGVSWYEAQAFCQWLTQHQDYNPEGYLYRLPSEDEWEYAARGLDRRPYPWGAEEPSDVRANFGKLFHGTTAVGCFSPGATPEGVYDLAGNIWEWTGSIYQPYASGHLIENERTNASKESPYVVRGGSWIDPVVALRSYCRYFFPPHAFYDYLGFRLARYRPM